MKIVSKNCSELDRGCAVGVGGGAHGGSLSKKRGISMVSGTF